MRKNKFEVIQYLQKRMMRSILRANEASEAKDFRQVEQIWQVYSQAILSEGLSTPLVKEIFTAMRYWPKELQNLTINRFRVGLAGMGRIEHTAINSRESQRQKESDENLPSQEFERVFENKLQSVFAVYDLIDVNNLPEQTLDANPIYWPSEIARDTARTFALQAKNEQAISMVHNEVSSLLQVDGDKLTAGKISALAVNELELGMLLNRIDFVIDALRHQLQANVYEGDHWNTGRTAQINQKLMRLFWKDVFQRNLNMHSKQAFSELIRMWMVVSLRADFLLFNQSFGAARRFSKEYTTSVWPFLRAK